MLCKCDLLCCWALINISSIYVSFLVFNFAFICLWIVNVMSPAVELEIQLPSVGVALFSLLVSFHRKSIFKLISPGIQTQEADTLRAWGWFQQGGQRRTQCRGRRRRGAAEEQWDWSWGRTATSRAVVKAYVVKLWACKYFGHLEGHRMLNQGVGGGGERLCWGNWSVAWVGQTSKNWNQCLICQADLAANH